MFINQAKNYELPTSLIQITKEIQQHLNSEIIHPQLRRTIQKIHQHKIKTEFHMAIVEKQRRQFQQSCVETRISLLHNYKYNIYFLSGALQMFEFTRIYGYFRVQETMVKKVYKIKIGELVTVYKTNVRRRRHDFSKTLIGFSIFVKALWYVINNRYAQ